MFDKAHTKLYKEMGYIGKIVFLPPRTFRVIEFEIFYNKMLVDCFWININDNDGIYNKRLYGFSDMDFVGLKRRPDEYCNHYLNIFDNLIKEYNMNEREIEEYIEYRPLNQKRWDDFFRQITTTRI